MDFGNRHEANAQLDETFEIRRTQRQLRDTLPKISEQHAGVGVQSPSNLIPLGEREPIQDQKDSQGIDSDPIDPLVKYGWQRLLNVVSTVFSDDWDESNELTMSSNVKCDFTSLKLLGTGTNFIVRKMPQSAAHAFGYTFSSRTTQRGIDILQGRRPPRAQVCKQIRAARWRGQADKSASMLQDVIIELQVLTHHPLMMHDNIIDFLGVLWEYDTDLQVWPVICIEYADHGTLASFLDRPTVLSFQEKMQLCLDIGNGLRALHGCGIIHGDIKPENVFIFSHSEMKYTAKIGDFSSSALNVVGHDPKNPQLSPGGYTPLWVAPEYSGPASFEALRLMDVFSFGLVVCAVAHNGTNIMNSFVRSEKPADAESFLRGVKTGANLVPMMIEVAQLEGYCEDLILEEFTTILEKTLGSPATRSLDVALDVLRRICKTDRTGERSGFRLIEDFDLSLDGSQNIRFDFKVLKAFPRTLQRQLVETKARRVSESISTSESTVRLFGNSLGKEALQVFRMIFESMGSDTLEEQVLRDEISVHDLWESAKQVLTSSTDVKDTVFEESISSLEILERLILGSVCSGPHAFGPKKYRRFRSQKHEMSLRFIEAAMKYKTDTMMPDPSALAPVFALGRPEWISTEDFDNWLKHSPYAGFFSLLSIDKSPEGYKLKLEGLQFAAALRNFYSVVEVNEALSRIRIGTNRAMDSQTLVHKLRQNTNNLLKAVPAEEEGENDSRLLYLAPLVDKFDMFRTELESSTNDQINYRDKDGRTPLLMAALYGNLEAAQSLLKKGADASINSYTGQSPFHCLSYIDESQQSCFATCLADAGADPNSDIVIGSGITSMSTMNVPLLANKRGTPLHHAILNNNLNAIRVLSSHGADALLESDAYLTPIALAAGTHCAEILEALIMASGISVSTWVDHYGNSLVFATLNGEWNRLRMYIHLDGYHRSIEKTLKVLQKHGANWDVVSMRYSVPALRFGVFSASSFVVNQLLELGLQYQINANERTIWPPLYQAIRRGDEHIFMLLLDNGADVNVRMEANGNTCLHACVESQLNGQFFLEALLNRGLVVDATNDMGRTALYEAVLRKQFNTANYLLSRGADVEHKDTNELTILGSLLEDGDNVLVCLKYLLEPLHGYTPSNFIVGRNNTSLFHVAAGARNKTSRTPWESKQIFDYLLAKYPFQEYLEMQEVTSGFTPLMIAVVGNNIEVARALLNAGASLDTPCLAGSSLRNAQLLCQLILASSDNSLPGLDFDEQHGGRAWKEMMLLLLQASEGPVVQPPSRLSDTAKQDRVDRAHRFLELVQSQKLPYLGGHLEDDEKELLEVPPVGPMDLASLNEIEVPSIIMAEFEMHLNPEIRQCVTIAQPAGYTLSRQDDRYYFIPSLCWIIETESLGTQGTIGQFLLQFPPYPSIGITFCRHIIDALTVVHSAKFIHGAINMSAVIMRTIKFSTSDIPSVIPQLYAFKASANERRNATAVYHRQGNESDAPELRLSPGEFRRPFTELLKCDIFSLGMLVVRCIAREDFDESCGSVETNPGYVASAITLVEAAMVKGNYGSRTTKKLVEALKALLEADPLKRTANLDGIRDAIEMCMADSCDEVEPEEEEGSARPSPRRSFLRSIAQKMKRIGK